jgi:hypothetical protein
MLAQFHLSYLPHISEFAHFSSRREQQKERNDEDHGHTIDDETRAGAIRLTVNHDQEDNQEDVRAGSHRIEFEEKWLVHAPTS